MKNATRYTVIVIVILLLIASGFAVLSINSKPKPLPDIADQLPGVISAGLNEFDYSLANNELKLVDYRYIDKDWVVATAIFTDLPEETEGRELQYIIKREEENLRLIGFSADGFSKNSVPEDTPEYVINEANE